MTQEHLDGDEVDEDGPLVGLGGRVAALEGIGQVLLGVLEVVVEHVLAPDVILVRHLLRLGVPEGDQKNIQTSYAAHRARPYAFSVKKLRLLTKKMFGNI